MESIKVSIPTDFSIAEISSEFEGIVIGLLNGKPVLQFIYDESCGEWVTLGRATLASLRSCPDDTFVEVVKYLQNQEIIDSIEVIKYA